MPTRTSHPLRVGIIALLQESNTFLPQPTTLRHFQEDLWAVGEDVRTRLADAHHEVGGFFEGLAAEQIQAVPLFAARAFPFGTITADAFQALIDGMLQACDQAGPLDGLLVAPHGATVSEAHPDADGYWLSLLRKRWGADFPIFGTLDPHANVSPEMVRACQVLVAYRTNPHIDQRQRGCQVARLMARTLRDEIRPTMAAAFPPLAIGIERQHTGEPPCSELVAIADAMLERPGVLANSLILGFPYADVPEMGSSCLVVCDGDPNLAHQYAQELATHMWSRRHRLIGTFTSITAGVELALQKSGRVGLLDMGDNVGGGSPADATELAAELLRRRVPQSFVCLYDPAVVVQAQTIGVGRTQRFLIGGKSSPGGQPLDGLFTVVSLHEGKFQEAAPRHGGITSFDQGPTAILQSEHGLTVMVTSRRMVPFSLQQLISCGLDPKHFHILVAKGVNAPIAAYASICQHFIRIDSPGVTCADMTRLEFRHRRRPLFPFEPTTMSDLGP